MRKHIASNAIEIDVIHHFEIRIMEIVKVPGKWRWIIVDEEALLHLGEDSGTSNSEQEAKSDATASLKKIIERLAKGIEETYLGNLWPYAEEK